MTHTETAVRSGRRSKLPLLVGAALIIAVLAVAVWYFLIRDTAPAGVNSTEAEQARAEALAEATGQTESAADGATATEGSGSEPSSTGVVAVDGTWTVDTSIGTFDDACLTEVCSATFAGFRIDEELASIGAKTVVGRSPGVTGSLTIDGTVITAAEFVVDMTGLITDSGARTNAIKTQAIETASFPEASFSLTEPIDLGSVPAEAEEIQVEATGELTIHGVTRTETIPLTASLTGDIITVFGELGPILLADYEIEKPTAAVVVSVEDNAIMELQVFFRRG